MIEIMRGDITTLDVDAIVNAANGSLQGGGGVDGAIHRAAGPALVRASAPLAPLETGGAVITPGFRLPARYVIHVVGPVWTDGEHDEPALLAVAGLLRARRAAGSLVAPERPGVERSDGRTPAQLAG